MSDEARGLRSIGSLTSQIVNTPETMGSTPTTSPRGSATSGTPRPALVPASGTGTRHGATGAATNLPAILDSALSASDPAKTDEALLASLEQRLGQPLVSVKHSFIDPVYGYDSEVTGYRMQSPVATASFQGARDLVTVALQGAPPQLIVRELARLRMLTKSRAGDESDREASYVALAEELVEFPPDVVKAALRRIARRETFFPALAELREECQRLVRNRLLIASALGIPQED